MDMFKEKMCKYNQEIQKNISIQVEALNEEANKEKYRKTTIKWLKNMNKTI